MQVDFHWGVCLMCCLGSRVSGTLGDQRPLQPLLGRVWGSSPAGLCEGPIPDSSHGQHFPGSLENLLVTRPFLREWWVTWGGG